MSELPALITAITGLVAAIGGLIAAVKAIHNSNNAHARIDDIVKTKDTEQKP